MTGSLYETAEKLIAERLGDRALEHCRAVAETAVLLAGIYAVDEGDARLAGLLHDWDRELDADELVERAQELGLAVDTACEREPLLLHARTAVAALREVLPGLSADVLQAIERHTVGGVDMSPLDMVLYVADTIAPGRRFDGVDDLREAAGNVGLCELFALCYAQSVGHLVRTRRFIHPDTVAVWNRYVARAGNE